MTPIIELRNVSKSFRLANGDRKYVLQNVSFSIAPNRIMGILGRNGTGKSTTLRIIAGTQDFDSGKVIRRGSVSWPVGFAGSFHGELTGAQNIRFIARIYGVDTLEMIEFVRDFSELGEYMDMPVRTYSAGMRSRLAFAASMGVPFDIYLMDEITAAGDAIFRAKCDAMLRSRLANSGALFVSHSIKSIEELCDCALVLEAGKATYFDNVQTAIKHHARNLDIKTHVMRTAD